MIKKQHLLALEFLLLCLVLPTVIIVFRLAPYMFFFLWASALYCWLTVLRKKDFKEVWKWEAVTKNNMKIIIFRWILACIGMYLFTLVVDPERLFSILFDRPGFLIFLFLLYPLLSAFPQEIVFCSFFFDRYATFFKSDRMRILASTIIFAYAHMLFINWVAPFLSLIAGFIFAGTYAKTRSLALVTIEHGLYGNFLFFVGLGWYFYGGAIH